MTVIYGQLRVSCGLSAIINALQPQDLKISPRETFGHWMDRQFLKLTNNADPSDPLVQLCGDVREYRWVAVLDYILLRRIRSSFLLCRGISPGALQTEVEYEHLDWRLLGPAIVRILERLNNSEEDWPIWHYSGELKDPAANIESEEFRKRALPLIGKIKVFYEIYMSNISVGYEAEWKHAIDNLVGFPEKITNSAIVTHLDYYKTDFELAGLLDTLGFELDRTYGMGYPKQVAKNSIILINRPGHWVTEDLHSGTRGVVLDSLTCSTDTIRMGDTFNYFKPVDNLKLMKKVLPKLEKLFPDIEIEIEEEELEEFPPLTLPVTDDPYAEARKFTESFRKKYAEGNIKEALNDLRIACALLEQTDKREEYLEKLLQFGRLCMEHEKILTLDEVLEKAGKIIEGNGIRDELKIDYHILTADRHAIHGDYNESLKALEKADELASKIADKREKDVKVAEKLYGLYMKLGALYGRSESFENSLRAYREARKFAMEAMENESEEEFAEDETGPPKKYWPAVIRGVDNRIKALEKIGKNKPNTGATRIG